MNIKSLDTSLDLKLMKQAMDQPSQHAVEYIDIRSLAHTFLEYKRLMALITLSIFTFTMLACMFQPPRYQASLLLKVQQKSPLLEQWLSNQNKNDAMDETLTAQIALIQSEYILRPVIQTLGLDLNILVKKQSLNDKKRAPFHITALQLSTKYLKEPLKLLIDRDKHYQIFNKKGHLVFEGSEGDLVSKKAQFIKIEAINTLVGSQFTLLKKPEFEVLHKISSHLRVTDLSPANEISNPARILRITLIDKDKKRLTKTLNEIAKVAQQQNIESKGAQAKIAAQFVNQQMILARASLDAAYLAYNAYRTQSGQVDLQFQTKYLLNHLTEVNKQLEKAHILQIKLLQKYTEKHPTIILLKQEIKALTANREALLKELHALPKADKEVTDLKRSVQLKTQQYSHLLNQANQLQFIQNTMTSDIQIISEASEPYLYQPLRLSLIAFLSLLVGAILGAITALVIKLIRTRFYIA